MVVLISCATQIDDRVQSENSRLTTISEKNHVNEGPPKDSTPEKSKVNETLLFDNKIELRKEKNMKTAQNGWYLPKPGESWQVQLTGKVNSAYDVDMYDLDLVETPQEVINELKKRGVKIICYFSAGSWEGFREDAADFPSGVIGKTLEGWPDEKWLDISRYEVFSDIIRKRLDLAVQKKCDGVDPDNVDGYQNDNGWGLTYEDQINYAKWLAEEAHKRNLSIGLKNSIDLIPELVDYFDFAINEQCFQYDECENLLVFINKQKAVFGIEYELEARDFCKEAKSLNFSWLKMEYDLNGSRISC